MNNKLHTTESTLDEIKRIMLERKQEICKDCKCDNTREEYISCCYCQDGDLYEKEVEE